jgi:hypothetical protein
MLIQAPHRFMKLQKTSLSACLQYTGTLTIIFIFPGTGQVPCATSNFALLQRTCDP